MTQRIVHGVANPSETRSVSFFFREMKLSKYGEIINLQLRNIFIALAFA